MKKKVKKLWVEALRSGKYKQCKNSLRRGEKFCCLGVLCDLYGKEKKVNVWNRLKPGDTDFQNGEFQHISRRLAALGSIAHLPASVMKWAGLSEGDPDVGFGASLASCNDNWEKSFVEIADYIEKDL